MAVDPEKTYHGRPCKYCSGTLRWKRSRACVDCARVKLRESHRAKQTPIACSECGTDFYRRGRCTRAVTCSDTCSRERALRKARERAREWWENADHITYHSRLLYIRRYQALKRQEARHGSLQD